MKISRIHTHVALMSKDHKFSFDKSQHKLEYYPELSMFRIDDTYVPVSNIREVLVEAEPKSWVEVEAAKSPKAEQPKKVKRGG